MAQEQSYPLAWPLGWPRKASPNRPQSKFGSGGYGDTLGSGVSRLRDELARLGATDVTISTNVRPRLDGLPSGDAANPADPGAAVYFRLKGQPRSLACDKRNRLADNLVALAKHIEAIRGQVRWGVGSIDQAFGGYLALTAMPAKKHWTEVLGLYEDASISEIERARGKLLEKNHPDKGGSSSLAADINVAYDEARAERGA